MAFDIEAAKADGYTDAEIQAHLNDMAGKPVALQAPEQNKHHEANVGTMQIGALGAAEKIGDVAMDAAKYAVPAYGLYKGGQAIANRPPAPVAPTGLTSGAVPEWDTKLNTPHPSTLPPTSPAAPPTAQNFIQRMAALGSKYAPLAGKAIAPALIAKDLYYTSPEERAILQQAEAEKRAKGWQPADPMRGRFFSGYNQ